MNTFPKRSLTSIGSIRKHFTCRDFSYARGPQAGVGLDFMNYVLQKDNLKFTAAIIAVGVVMAEITYTTYKVSNFDSEGDAKLDRNDKKVRSRKREV